jgi:hypothetical protein
MKNKFIYILFLLITTQFSNGIGYSENIGNNTLSETSFLDVIIDESHAYVYLSCCDCNDGYPYSIYASLMPKDQEGEDELSRFPKIIQWLLREQSGDPIAEHLNENGVSIVKFPNGTSMQLNDLKKIVIQENGGFTAIFTNGTVITHGINDDQALSFKEIVTAVMMGVYYMVSDYIGTAQEGEIINTLPDSSEIKIQKRFYLNAEQAKQALDLINKSFQDSSNGKVVYDGLNHNCIDYTKEIYDGIGLNKINGEFLSHFDTDPNCSIFSDNQKCTILNTYKKHNERSLGLWTMISGIWEILMSEDEDVHSISDSLE